MPGLALILLVCAVLAQPGVASAANDISTLAGTGVSGYSGDGGPATAAKLDLPRGVAWTADGGVLIAEATNDTVRLVSPGGTITTAAGTGVACPTPTSPCGDGGDARAAQLNFVHAVSATPDGGFLIADTLDHRIRKVGPAGTITTVAGTGNTGYGGDMGFATAARISAPRGVASLPDGGFLIADSDNHRIRRVLPTGTIRTVAGTGTAGFSGDGGQATAAKINRPFGVAATPDGGFLIADAANNRIRRVDASGVITTVAGNGAGCADGTSACGDGGLATAASLRPVGVYPTPGGGFLLADQQAHRVRHVWSNGRIGTVAGTGVPCANPTGSCGDGGPATAAELNFPKGVAVDPQGDFVIPDAENEKVRLVDFDPSAPAPPTGLSATAGDGSVTLDWRDNAESDLAGYDVYRSASVGGPYSKVNGTLATDSAYTDSGLQNGTTYYYVVQAVDAEGKESGPSSEASATPAAEPSSSSYRDEILSTPGLVSYWRLGEGSGTTAADEKGANPGSYQGGPGLGQPGAISGDADTAVRFDGQNDEMSAPGPALSTEGSIEGWFYWEAGVALMRDNTGGGGWILAYDAGGKVAYRVGGTTFVTSRSTASLRNGWHHIVLTRSGGSTAFYVDGALLHQGSNAGSAPAQPAWHVMRNGSIASQYSRGQADEVAIYNTALSAATVQQHYGAGS